MTVYFAPFHGISMRCFRRVFFAHFSGIDAAVSPFFSAGDSRVLSKARFADIFPVQSEPVPLIVQIIGSKKQEITDTVNFLYDKGYEHINWNIACPVSQIVRKQRGCGLMPHAETIEDIVADVCRNTVAKFSIKMRLGMYRSEESVEIIRRMNNYPVDFIAIHARLGNQLYAGQTDKDAFETCLQLSTNRLCYNGDIYTTEDFRQLQVLFPDLKCCMLGRGMLRNPFLAEQIRGTNKNASKERIRFEHFYEDLIACYSDAYPSGSVLNRLKELWHYFAVGFALSENDLQQLLCLSDRKAFVGRTMRIIRGNLSD
jgi:tRNA-dihydrouridine synthase